MPELKPITAAGVPAALLKAHRYRLLNDSSAAESICLDVLLVEPDNAEAIVTYVLSITDQFDQHRHDDVRRARDAASRLADPYRNAYYNGIICERWAKAIIRRGALGHAEMAYEWIGKAFDWYEKAERLAAPGNDEAILRWNTCVRILQRDPRIKAREAEEYVPSLE